MFIKENRERYCVYRLLNNDNILYIGKSKQFKERIFNHLRGKSNIPQECVDQINRIQFLEFAYEGDMNIFEIYAISYFKPKYNKDSIGAISLLNLKMPKVWNELDINTFRETINTDIISGKTQYEKLPEEIFFNKEIFLNKELTNFLESHFNKELSELDLKKLANLCKIEDVDIERINNYIVYNNSKAEIKYCNNKYKLIKNKKGKRGYGSWCKRTIRGITYEGFAVVVSSNKKKCFYGHTKEEVIKKIEQFIRTYYSDTQLLHCEDTLSVSYGTICTELDEGLKKDVATLKEKQRIIEQEKRSMNNKMKGINKTLYEESQKRKEEQEQEQKQEQEALHNNILPKLLTKADVMEQLHIKNNRTFNKIIEEGKIPYIKILDRKYLFPEDDFNEWIKDNINKKGGRKRG